MPPQNQVATKRKKNPDLWRPGSPHEEAKTLVRLIGKNGDTADTLRELIRVNDGELIELREWAASSPAPVAVGIEGMLRFRNAVLAEFDRLLASSQ
jgi:hypothetical protein